MVQPPPAALDGVRVLDLSRLVPGPMASAMLADLGAEVTKIEEPGGGRRARDERILRGEPPDELTADELRWRTVSPLERNKRSITLDLRSATAREIAIDLTKRSDVLLEGFRPGVMERLGLGYDTVRQHNPRIVYCSITGYGQTGPRSATVGHDLNYVADAGAASLIGDDEGRPIVPINLLADYAAGSYRAVIGILAALMARERTGLGQLVDVAMADGVLALLSMEVAALVATGTLPRAGHTRLTGGMAYYNVYECKDGRFISIGCNEPHFFRVLCDTLDLPELVDQQLVPLPEQRRLKQILAARFAERTLEEWLRAFEGREIAFAPVRTIDEVLTDEHYRAREMLVDFDTEAYGRVTQVAPAIRLSATPARVRHLAPTPGQDTRIILRELGLDDGRIEQLAAEGVLG